MSGDPYGDLMMSGDVSGDLMKSGLVISGDAW